MLAHHAGAGDATKALIPGIPGMARLLHYLSEK
jgi:hypothetical protein